MADSSYHSSDSCIVFVSTRSVGFENGKFILGNTIANDKSLRFYNIYFNGADSKMAPRNSLAEAMDNANISYDYLVYTEGHGKLFSDNIERGISAARIYGISIIMFDWPSRVPGYSFEKNFYVSVHNSKSVTKQFHELLLLLGNYKKHAGKERVHHISMFFHSMGNYVLLSTLKKHGATHYNNDLIDNIIFNAACIPSRGHEKWIEKLSFQKNIYIMYNSKDQTLKAATFLLGKFLLGYKPLRLAKNAYYFNLKPVANISHNCFLRKSFLNNHPEIHKIYNNLFHAVSIDLTNSFIESVDGTNNKYIIVKK